MRIPRRLHFSGLCFFFQAEDGIRDLVRSRGLGDVYKRQARLLRPVVPTVCGITDRSSAAHPAAVPRAGADPNLSLIHI